MNFYLFIQRRLFSGLVIIVCGLFLIHCSKDDSITVQNRPQDNIQIETRGPQFHWKCSVCGLLNAGWLSECSKPGCEGKYSNEHGNLLLTFKTILEVSVGGGGGGGPRFEKGDVNEVTISNRIVLPGGYLADYAPSPWYETAKAQKFYNDLKTLGYYSDPIYAEGVDIGWYRTVRMLYPGVSNLTKIETAHDRWLLGDGRKMKDSRGRGLKAGTKAAIDAFGAR